MAHHSYVGGNLAYWQAHVISGAEMWAFDQSQFANINGDAGGTWAPAAAIVIGGSGLSLTGSNHALINSAILTTGASTTINVGGSMHAVAGSNWWGTFDVGVGGLTTTVTIGASATVSSNASAVWTGTFSFDASATIAMSSGTDLTGSWFYAAGGTVSLGGSTVFGAASTVTSDAGTDLAGTYTFNPAGTVDLQGQTIVRGALQLYSTGHIEWRKVNAVDSNHSYGVNTVDIVYIPYGNGSRTYTILNTGAVANKSVIRVTCASVNTCLLIHEDGSSCLPASITGLNASTSGAYWGWVDLMYFGTNDWKPIAWLKNP